MNEYIGWPSHVNRIILADTTMSIGKDAVVSESLKSGKKRSELAGSFCPDVFSVVMDFEADDYLEIPDYNNEGLITLDRTEHQIFTDWYKYRIKYGTVPFEFPKIVYTPGKGYSTLDGVMGLYKITSAFESSKSGSCQRVKMTWEEAFSGDVTVEAESAAINGITAITKDYIDVTFSAVAEDAPVSSLFQLYDGNTAISTKAYCFDGAYTARIYYNTLSAGNHTISFATTAVYGGMEIVPKGTFTATINVEAN